MQMKCFCDSELFKVYKVGHQFLLVCPTCRCERIITSPGVRVRVYEPSVSFKEEPVKVSEIMYCAGTEDDHAGGVGMWAGPTPNVEELLKYTPDDYMKGGTSYIIEYDNNENHRRVYRWDSKNFSWVKFYDTDKIPHG
jgi:hypothetical protein